MVAVPPWGHHLILDVQGCDRAVVTDEAALDIWIRDLVETIGMQAYGEPLIKHFGEGDLAGLTVMQLITTSNISAHFMDHSGDGYVDVFSCQWFSVEAVMEQVCAYFRPRTIGWFMMERRAGLLAEIVDHGVVDVRGVLT